MNCKVCQTVLPDLLLDPAGPVAASAQLHLDACPACKQEFHALQATFNLLDTWEAPEPSTYFDQKLAVRLREEQSAPPESWFERLRDRILFNTGRQFRPALTGALALALLVGGGTAANLFSHPSGRRANYGSSYSATVNDLQILDKNAQALQTMDQLLQDDSSEEAPAPPVT
jgi:hypothetical protein